MNAIEFASKLELALLGHMSSDEFWKKTEDFKTALECLDAGANIIGSLSTLEIFKEFLNK